MTTIYLPKMDTDNLDFDYSKIYDSLNLQDTDLAGFSTSYYGLSPSQRDFVNALITQTSLSIKKEIEKYNEELEDYNETIYITFA
jgi:hypothetical protein